MSGQHACRRAPPRVGFVSLGCPKALVDSEQILTQLRAEGYAIAPDVRAAPISSSSTPAASSTPRSRESLDAIGEALAENGKVIVTGCLGAKGGGDFVRDAHPAGARGHRSARDAGSDDARCTRTCRSRTTRSSTSSRRKGIKLTPKHYAYLKISEGCNHRCTFCIIPSMRGDLVQPARSARCCSRRSNLLQGRRAGAAGRSRRTRAPTASTCATAPASGAGGRSRRG